MIGLGELLWDCFPEGRLPGGAPANVAFHAQQLGLSSAVATRVGKDDLGDDLRKFLSAQSLTTEFVQIDPNHQTGTVTVWPHDKSNTGYTFLENSAWDFLEATPELLEAVHSARAICFGTLGQRRPVSRHTIQQCLRSVSSDCLVVYDVNLRPPFFAKDWIAKSMSHATIVKLNDEEVKVLTQLFDFRSEDEVRFAKRLLDDYKQLQLVCVTRGSQGCLAVTCGEVIELPGVPVDVVNTVGAGDAFTAAIIYGHLQKWPLASTLELANQFGALVAGRIGAMPTLSDELSKLKSSLDWSFRDTIIP